ncbi:hypothetical protein [Burkholderia multivorans]|uniref:hypothetical protein n=1 Tax=Burkholderia multivorans TaxID=87883 RepID=UPI001239C5FB|nr:hypothetical protein [Burkholderia multivorans]MBU9247803.1 hypothetical protein [Burkholderia multivorans]QET31711.1 hypothetical protein FOB31_18850 [Burkholderia multivorans]QET40869.1 hypothetical protein FOB30_25010 [Burkholderia multivorans]
MSMESLMQDEIAALESDAALLERAGRKTVADRIRRDVVKIRRQHARLEARRAAAEERGPLVDLIAALERNLSANGGQG